MQSRTGVFVAVALLASRAADAAPLARGDVLVAVGNQIVRVHPDTGIQSVFSPPPGGANLIPFFIKDMVVDADGPVFVTTDDHKLIQIDRESGVQSEVRDLDYVCINFICFLFDQGALDVGSQPSGLAIDSEPAPGKKRSLWVGGSTGVTLHRVDRTEVGSTASVLLDSDGRGSGSAMDLDDGPNPALWRMLHNDLGDLSEWSSGAPVQATLFSPAAGFVTGIDWANGDVFFTTSDASCTPSVARVYLGESSPLLLTQAGWLRCPRGVMVDPQSPVRLWIAEDLGRLVRVEYDGVHWVQSLVASFADTVYQVAVVPEPSVAAAELVALLVLARLRARRAAQR